VRLNNAAGSQEDAKSHERFHREVRHIGLTNLSFSDPYSEFAPVRRGFLGSTCLMGLSHDTGQLRKAE
jgi:hypothetical protein